MSTGPSSPQPAVRVAWGDIDLTVDQPEDSFELRVKREDAETLTVSVVSHPVRIVTFPDVVSEAK